MTNEEQWNLFAYCTSHGLTPMQCKIVVMLAASGGGMTVDEIERDLYGTEPMRYRHRVSASTMSAVKMQLAGIRKKEGNGIALHYEVEPRADIWGRVKNWRRHKVRITRVAGKPFSEWIPPYTDLRPRKEKAA